VQPTPSIPSDSTPLAHSPLVARVLGWLEPVKPDHRLRSTLIVTALATVLGWLDYISGIWVSLQFFYLVPIVLAVAWLGWRHGSAIAIACVAFRFFGDVAGGIFLHVEPGAVWWNRLIDVGVAFILIGIFHALITLQRQLERRVAERTAALSDAAHTRRQLEQELLTVAANERNSFGQELHDDICQHLVGTAFAAKVLASRLAPHDAASAAEAQAIVTLLEVGADKTRKLARGLLLAEITPAELAEKLAQLAADARGSGVSCRFQEQGDTTLDSADTAGQLFRIAQEAVRNALRHAAPRTIEIFLTGHPDAVSLTVTDDGCGLPSPEHRGTGMGLRIMSYRAAYAGGTLSIGAHLLRGTRVYCHLPFRPAAP
jgi:signal transduction histidine kinase